MSNKSILLIVLLIVLAGALRFLWLENIQYICFDEVHYIYEAAKYQQGVLAQERANASAPKHPLLSILFMSYGMQLLGFRPLGWRLFSAVFGTLSIAAFYFLVRRLFSERAALIAALLLAIDFLHLPFSRIAVVDIYLVFFILAGYYFLARAVAAERSDGLLLAGTCFGLALATKWFALLPGLTGLLIYLWLGRDRGKLLKGPLLLFVFPAALFLLTCLFLNLTAGMDIVSWAKFELANLGAHMSLSVQHPLSAAAWSWPFLLRSTPIIGTEPWIDPVRAVIAFGNPLVYWVLVPVLFWLIIEYRRERRPAVLFVLLAFAGTYLPWLVYEFLGQVHLFPARHLFFYYFLSAVPFYLAGLAHVLDRLLDNRSTKVLALLYLCLVIILFLYFSPILFGFPISPAWLRQLIWFKGWMY